MLEEQRGLAKLQLANILIVVGANSLCSYECGGSSSYSYAYMQSLNREDLWPGDISRMSISRALIKADGMPDPVRPECMTQCSMARFHDGDLPYRRRRIYELGTFDETIGLCLRCVRLDTTESNCSDHNR